MNDNVIATKSFEMFILNCDEKEMSPKHNIRCRNTNE